MFDETLCKHLVPYDHLALIDAASLLWRMSSVCGLDPGEERWKKVMDGFGYYNKGEIKTALYVHVQYSGVKELKLKKESVCM